MNCIKTINAEYEYGTTRFLLLASLTFTIVFCLSYVFTNFNNQNPNSDANFLYFLFALFWIYPVHKLIHYIALFSYKKSISYKFKIKFTFVPILYMRIKEPIPKKRYLVTLIAPFIILNPILLTGAFIWLASSHYFCLLLAFHCSICLLDLLYIKDIWRAPKNAIIEETPRGYEILVPQFENDSSNLSH